VCQACDSWLLSKHALKPSTIAGHRVSLGPIRSELGHIEIQKLTKADLDGLIGRLRRGEVPGRKRWSARSVNYMLYLCTAVLEDQVAQGNAVRNVAKLVDRIAGEAGEMRALTERDMFRILDHECRDRHLWALALYGLRRGEVAGLRWTNVDLKAKTVRIVENRVAVGAEIMSGTPYHPNLLTFRWGRMLDGLSIEQVRLHDARHSCATLMHLRQVPIAVIAAWLGHASAAFTLSVYVHSQDDVLKAAATSFGRVVMR
jgi:integrase